MSRSCVGDNAVDFSALLSPVAFSRRSYDSNRFENDFTRHVGQPFIPAIVAEGQARVVKAEQVEDRRVDVMRVLSRVRCVIHGIGRADDLLPLMPPPASHMENPCGLWSRPSAPSLIGIAQIRRPR